MTLNRVGKAYASKRSAQAYAQRESSLLASVYAAREDAEDQIEGVTTVEEAQEILSTYADAIREVAAEYEAAKEDENGNVFNTTAEERQEALESAADEVEDYDIDVEVTADCETCSGDGEVECEACSGTGNVEADGKDAEECTDCGGSGKVECEEDDCEDGQVPDLDALRSSLGDALQTDLGC